MWRLRILYGIPIWIIMLPVKPVFILLGYVMIPIATLCRAYEMTEARPPGHPKHYDGDKYNFTWKIMKPWDNWSDGIANRNYFQYDSFFWQVFRWSAVRNSANGLREMPLVSLKIKAFKVKYVGSLGLPKVSDNIVTYPAYKGRFPHWYFCWHGPYTCFLWQFKLSENHMRRLWIGFKMKPQDLLGLDKDDYRIRGAAFTFQMKRVVIR